MKTCSRGRQPRGADGIGRRADAMTTSSPEGKIPAWNQAAGSPVRRYWPAERTRIRVNRLAPRLGLHRRGNHVADAANQIPDRLPINLVVNGVRRTLDLVPWITLLDALRDHLALTGTKKGCDHGQCGACTVLVDGRRVNSCLMLAVMKDGSEITTVEGLARDGALHPLQQAFIDHDAFQCGYCTPGQICSAAGLLAEGRARDAEEIRELMSGNLCRCGAYPNIVAAIQQAMGQP
jgi:xanthine dehydrogenase YagT iron-sulfur-binding subunit